MPIPRHGYLGAILDVLRNNKEPEPRREIHNRVKSRMKILDNENSSKVNKHIDFCLTCLKKLKLSDNPVTGYWALTEEGKNTYIDTIDKAKDLYDNYLKKIRQYNPKPQRPNAIDNGGSVKSGVYSIDQIIKDGCFLDKSALSEIRDQLIRKKNLILRGPPGTGKTWLAKRLAYAHIGAKFTKNGVSQEDIDRVRVVQFHPSLSYEDFVRGYRPGNKNMLALIDGIFLNTVKDAANSPRENIVLIIEEINRGNPANIFGEMLTLIENDKRISTEGIELTYPKHEKEKIHISKNLFIIGTMNIADRSLALVDFAFRRRFAFVDMKPQFNNSWRKWCNERGITGEMINKIGSLMNELNKAIREDKALGSQFEIGHSFVTPKQDEMINDETAWFQRIVGTEIRPLLEEYWFHDPDKAHSLIGKLEGS